MSDPDRKACAEAAQVCACFNLRKASRTVTQHFDAVLQPSGLRSTQFVLLVVAYAEEPVSLPRLAQALVLDRSTLTRNLKPLERDGLLRLERPAGGRGAVVRISAKGRRVLAATVPLWEKAQTSFVASLGAQRWGRLLEGLTAAVNVKN